MEERTDERIMINAYLVDDEEHALTILELFLERAGGVKVIGRSKNGYEAIQELSYLHPDVIFLDIEMPQMNGLELAEVIRNTDPDVPIIFVTAYDQYAVSAFEQEALDYILKPLEPERLSKAIARIRRMKNKEQIDREQARLANGATGEAKLSVRLFGTLFAGLEGGSCMEWRTSKEKELLAYLALNGDSRMHRDQIIEDLWPDVEYMKAKIYLHTCVSWLRKNVKQLGLDGIIKYQKEQYFLEPERIDVDVLAFKSMVQKVKKPGKAAVGELEQAMSLYQGLLLEDEDFVWAGQESEQLDKLANQARLLLGETYLGLGLYRKAVEKAQQTVEFSPYSEEAYRLMMKGYQRLGRNDQVLQAYTALTHKLSELMIKPSEMTSALFKDICSLDQRNER